MKAYRLLPLNNINTNSLNKSLNESRHTMQSQLSDVATVSGFDDEGDVIFTTVDGKKIKASVDFNLSEGDRVKIQSDEEGNCKQIKLIKQNSQAQAKQQENKQYNKTYSNVTDSVSISTSQKIYSTNNYINSIFSAYFITLSPEKNLLENERRLLRFFKNNNNFTIKIISLDSLDNESLAKTSERLTVIDLLQEIQRDEIESAKKFAAKVIVDKNTDDIILETAFGKMNVAADLKDHVGSNLILELIDNCSLDNPIDVDSKSLIKLLSGIYKFSNRFNNRFNTLGFIEGCNQYINSSVTESYNNKDDFYSITATFKSQFSYLNLQDISNIDFMVFILLLSQFRKHKKNITASEKRLFACFNDANKSQFYNISGNLAYRDLNIKNSNKFSTVNFSSEDYLKKTLFDKKIINESKNLRNIFAEIIDKYLSSKEFYEWFKISIPVNTTNNNQDQFVYAILRREKANFVRLVVNLEMDYINKIQLDFEFYFNSCENSYTEYIRLSNSMKRLSNSNIIIRYEKDMDNKLKEFLNFQITNSFKILDVIPKFYWQKVSSLAYKEQFANIESSSLNLINKNIKFV